MRKKEVFFYLEQQFMNINEQCVRSFFECINNKDSVIFEKLSSLLKIILSELKKNEQIEDVENYFHKEINNFMYNRGFSFKYIKDNEFENVHDAEMHDMKKQYLSNVLKNAYACKSNLEKDCVNDDDYFKMHENVDFFNIENVDINNPYAELISASKANGVPMRVSFEEARALFDNVKSILDSNFALDKKKRALEIVFAEYELYF